MSSQDSAPDIEAIIAHPIDEVLTRRFDALLSARLPAQPPPDARAEERRSPPPASSRSTSEAAPASDAPGSAQRPRDHAAGAAKPDRAPRGDECEPLKLN